MKQKEQNCPWNHILPEVRGDEGTGASFSVAKREVMDGLLDRH